MRGREGQRSGVGVERSIVQSSALKTSMYWKNTWDLLCWHTCNLQAQVIWMCGPVLCYQLVRSLAWRHSHSICTLEVIFLGLSRLLWMPPGGTGRSPLAFFIHLFIYSCSICKVPLLWESPSLVLEGILKGILFPRLDDIFLHAGQGKEPNCLLFGVYLL